jgi:PKD repeat protein
MACLTGAAAARADITAVEGTPFNGSLGTCGFCISFGLTYTIDWGDHETSQGTASSGAVIGTHTYTEAGTYAYSVARAGITGTATVSDAPLSPGQAAAISAVAGTAPGNPVVATFADGNPFAVAGDFSASIDWGEGPVEAAVVSAAPEAGFEVSGSHVYGTPGTYPVRVHVDDRGGSTLEVDTTATISGALAAGSAPALHAAAQSPYSGSIATFTDGTPNVRSSDLLATIDWGDKTTTTGTVATTGGDGFSVSGNHTYANRGSFAVTVTITAAGLPALTITGSAIVIVAAPAAGAAVNPAAVEGSSFSGPVASFTDPTPNAVPGDFSVDIDWGDGDTGTGTIAAGPSGGFEVSGTHTYHAVGKYPFSLSISAAAGTVAMAGTATVQDARLDAGSPLTLTTFESVPFDGVIATFIDANPYGAAADYTATIDWGDHTAAGAGKVTGASSAGFQVAGSHVYSTAGTYTVTVTISDEGGSAVVVHDTASAGVGLVPETTAVLSPATPNGRNGWYVTPVHVSLRSDGQGLTVAATRCALDPHDVPATYEALPDACPFAGSGTTIPQSGAHTIYAASVNVAGEAETPEASRVNLDTVTPTITCEQTPDFVEGGSGESVSARVTDLTSGAASSTVTTPAKVRSSGNRKALLTGHDNAGNAASALCPYRVLGHLNSTVEWGVKHYPRYTVPTYIYATHVPDGARIRALCRGGGCPFATRAMTVSAKRGCAKRTACHSAQRSGTRTVNLTGWLENRHLAVRTRLQISIADTERFGFTWVFVMRPNRDPSAEKACLRPGSFTAISPGC